MHSNVKAEHRDIESFITSILYLLLTELSNIAALLGKHGRSRTSIVVRRIRNEVMRMPSRIPAYTRTRIVELANLGYRIRDIEIYFRQEGLQITSTGIRGVLKRYRETKSLEDTHRSGRPKLLNEEDVDLISQHLIATKKFVPAKDIRAKILKERGIVVSVGCIKRTRRKLGWESNGKNYCKVPAGYKVQVYNRKLRSKGRGSKKSKVTNLDEVEKGSESTSKENEECSTSIVLSNNKMAATKGSESTPKEKVEHSTPSKVLSKTKMAASESQMANQQPSEGASSAKAVKNESNDIQMLAAACEGQAQLPSENSSETEVRFTPSAARLKALKLKRSALKRRRNSTKMCTKKMRIKWTKIRQYPSAVTKTTSAATVEKPTNVHPSLSITSDLLASVPPVITPVVPPVVPLIAQPVAQPFASRVPSTIASIPPTLTPMASLVPSVPRPLLTSLVTSPGIGIPYQPPPHQIRYQAPHVSTASTHSVYQPYQYQLAPNTVQKPSYVTDLEKRVRILELTVKLLQEKLSYNETSMQESTFTVSPNPTPPPLPPSNAPTTHVLPPQQVSFPQSPRVPPPPPANSFNLMQVANSGPTEENHYSFLRYIFTHYIRQGTNEYGITYYTLSQGMEHSIMSLGSDGAVISRVLMRKLFTPYELSVSNVRGVGKQALDPIRISAIREACMKASQIPLHQQEMFWRNCVKVMDTANRNSRKYIKTVLR